MDALPLVPAIVLSQTQAIIAAILVVVAVIIAWKFLKFAFRIALIVAAAVVLFFVLRAANVLYAQT
jgi:hypothetical protein